MDLSRIRRPVTGRRPHGGPRREVFDNRIAFWVQAGRPARAFALRRVRTLAALQCFGTTRELFARVVLHELDFWSSCKGQTVDALASGGDEGRGKLRKAAGRRKAAFDPQISEWGNPARVMPGHPPLNT